MSVVKINAITVPEGKGRTSKPASSVGTTTWNSSPGSRVSNCSAP